jgi:hypothetical protein
VAHFDVARGFREEEGGGALTGRKSKREFTTCGAFSTVLKIKLEYSPIFLQKILKKTQTVKIYEDSGAGCKKKKIVKIWGKKLYNKKNICKDFGKFGKKNSRG